MFAQLHLQGEIWSQKKQIPQSSKAFRLDSTISGEPSASACTTCKDCFLRGEGRGHYTCFQLLLMLEVHILILILIFRLSPVNPTGINCQGHKNSKVHKLVCPQGLPSNRSMGKAWLNQYSKSCVQMQWRFSLL